MKRHRGEVPGERRRRRCARCAPCSTCCCRRPAPAAAAEGEVLCGRCAPAASSAGSTSRPACPSGCALPLPAGLVQLEWCAAFTGPVRAALHALKYRGERRLAGAAGAVTGRALAHVPAAAARCSCRCPSTRARRRERGFDQAEDLAGACRRRHLGCPWCRPRATRQRTAAQHRLGTDASERRNVGGAFAVRPGAERRGRAAAGSCSSTTSRPPARPSPDARRRCSTPGRWRCRADVARER